MFLDNIKYNMVKQGGFKEFMELLYTFIMVWLFLFHRIHISHEFLKTSYKFI